METQLEISKELFEKLLKAKDEISDQIEIQEEISVNDVYNGMMTLLNILIEAKPELMNIVETYYEATI